MAANAVGSAEESFLSAIEIVIRISRSSPVKNVKRNFFKKTLMLLTFTIFALVIENSRKVWGRW